MDAHLPSDILRDLKAADAERARKRAEGFSILSNGVRHRVLHLTRTGFDLKDDGVTRLRGYVDLHKGPHRLSRCLILAASQGEGVVRYEIKMQSRAREGAPADHVRTGPAIAGLLTHQTPS